MPRCIHPLVCLTVSPAHISHALQRRAGLHIPGQIYGNAFGIPLRNGTDHEVRADTKPCRHRPTMVMVERTSHGYKIRCLMCGEVGPERDDPGDAFGAYDAMRRQRHR